MEHFLDFDRGRMSLEKKADLNKVHDIIKYMKQYNLDCRNRAIFLGSRFEYVVNAGQINSMACFVKEKSVRKMKNVSKNKTVPPDCEVEWLIVPNGWVSIITYLTYTLLVETSVILDVIHYRLTELYTPKSGAWKTTFSAAFISFVRTNYPNESRERFSHNSNHQCLYYDLMQVKILRACKQAIRLGMYSHVPGIEEKINEFIEHNKRDVDHCPHIYLVFDGWISSYPDKKPYSTTVSELALYIHDEYLQEEHVLIKRQKLDETSE